ncbi:MAG: hypothetical protein ACFFG0_02575 [Candidatus Thorarchaeota archaeon]
MIPSTKITNLSLTGFFDEYQLTEDDIEWLLDMHDNGEVNEAIDILIRDNFLPAGFKYDNAIRTLLGDAESGILEIKDKNKNIRNVILLGIGLNTIWKSIFNKYATNVYSKYIFNITGLKNIDVKKTILSETLGLFDRAISGTLSATSTFVTNSIRSLQKEFIIENLKISNQKITGELLNQEIIRFKSELEKKYPEIYRALKNGNILASKKESINGIRHYKIENYIDMSVRTTLLNLDRSSNLIMASVNNEPVVEYFLADPRNVKKDREICQEILNNKVFGKSILAIDDKASGILNIMTVDEAITTPDYALGVNCRHSLRRCDNDYLLKINKALGGN